MHFLGIFIRIVVTTNFKKEIHVFCPNLDRYHHRKYLVRAGDLNYAVDEGTEQQFDVESHIIHEDYDSSTLRNDIALIKLLENANGKCIV